MHLKSNVHQVLNLQITSDFQFILHKKEPQPVIALPHLQGVHHYPVLITPDPGLSLEPRKQVQYLPFAFLQLSIQILQDPYL